MAFRLSIIISCILLIAAAAVGGGWLYFEYLALQRELPTLHSMADFHPFLTSLVYSNDGRVIGQFAFEDRVPVSIAEVPKLLQEALLATEDTDFYQHHGVNFQAILRAAKANLLEGKISQGGSTITQQVARDLFLGREKKWMRKIKEALIAVELESRFTKNQILELYLNETYFGHGAYGIKSAALRYFDKELHELTLSECALLAGLPQAPSAGSPFVSMERAERRRSVVLSRMVEAGFISQGMAEKADAEPIVLSTGSRVEFAAPYFLEYVRRTLEEQLGTQAVHAGGLRIFTSLDTRLQAAAQEAVERGLLEITKRRGYDPSIPLADVVGEEPAVGADGVVPVGTVLRLPIEEVGKTVLKVRMDNTVHDVDPGHDGWTIARDLRTIFTSGEEALFIIEKASDVVRLGLYQKPTLQGSLLSMCTGTGYISAWIGGRDFAESKFDRVYQAHRQPGSGFKPIIYTAALDTRMTPADIVYDAPIVTEIISEEDLRDEPEREDGTDAVGAPGDEGEDGEEGVEEEQEQEYWRPGNYSGRFYGATTLRQGLEQSRNLVTIRLLSSIGVRTAIQYARLMGIESPLADNLSLSLGSSGVTQLELVGAYGVLANQGDWIKPIAIKRVLDYNGQVIMENLPEIRRALSPQASYLTTSLMQGVVERGTGRQAQVLGRPLAGKTGTPNDYRDAWFNGFSRQHITSVWVGFDEPQPIGRNETGARAALPIWIDFMREAHRGLPVLDFIQPPGIRLLGIDAETGLLATDKCSTVITEAFIAGTEPLRLCDAHKMRSTQFLRFDTDDQASEEETVQDSGGAGVSPFSYSVD
ncbi:transglycosylase domain-containing protein [bacterium]|nr:transglycosylase domain-containing protein [candidate division CSSED10-310 bacterium]